MQRKGQSILLSLRKVHLFFKSRDSIIFICENILFLRDFTTVYIIRILISLQGDIITVASLGTSDHSAAKEDVVFVNPDQTEETAQ